MSHQGIPQFSIPPVSQILSSSLLRNISTARNAAVIPHNFIDDDRSTINTPAPTQGYYLLTNDPLKKENYRKNSIGCFSFWFI